MPIGNNNIYMQIKLYPTTCK